MSAEEWETDETDDWTTGQTMSTTKDGTRTESGGGVHPVNLVHLVTGIVFAGLVGIWAAVSAGWLPVDDLRWILPVPWLVAGSAGLLAATLGRWRERVAGGDGDVGVVGDHPVDPRA